MAALSDGGQDECLELVGYCLVNAGIIEEGFSETGLIVYGGINASYMWVNTPNDIASRDFSDRLVCHHAHLVGTQGAGFELSDEGDFRLSALVIKKI